MEVNATKIGDVLLIEPTIFKDARGFFYESFNQKTWQEKVGNFKAFVQDNHSLSYKNVIRGLHYQINKPQGKLVRVIRGEVFDVAVDVRKKSPTYGEWVGEILSDYNKRMLWIPEGFAHGFLTLSESAEIIFKTTDYFSPESEITIIWNDDFLNIVWPLQGDPILSEKDKKGINFNEIYAM